MKKAANHKICPHCDGHLDEKDLICPACGKLYWQPDSQPCIDMNGGETEDETMGCLPIFFWPLLISLAVTISLILVGFVIHVFIQFEANQVKAIWILCSVAVGGLVYTLVSKIKKKNS